MSEQMAEALRAAIRATGKSSLQLSKECGLTQPVISEFLRGKDIKLSSAQRLADHLGLQLIVKSKRTRGGKT